MRSLQNICALVVFAFLIGCGKKDSAGDIQGSGTTNIEGTYLIVCCETFGEKEGDDEINRKSEADRTVTITKDEIDIKIVVRETLKYKIDPSKAPTEIDVITPENAQANKPFYGIYKFEGDILTFFIWGSEDPKNRPREFKTLEPVKPWLDKVTPDAKDRVGGFMIVTLKKTK
jgi:uncharacterized protein (TIGR03067 family)